jgi:hypothetical protein
MTVKERWTVYPLLLLAIGLALRAGPGGSADSAGDSVKAFKGQFENLEVGLLVADGIFCRELAVFEKADGTERILIHAGRVEGGGGGRIEIRDAEGNDAVAIGTTADSREGGVEFFGPDGVSLGKLGPKKPAAAGQDSGGGASPPAQ